MNLRQIKEAIESYQDFDELKYDDLKSFSFDGLQLTIFNDTNPMVLSDDVDIFIYENYIRVICTSEYIRKVKSFIENLGGSYDVEYVITEYREYYNNFKNAKRDLLSYLRVSKVFDEIFKGSRGSYNFITKDGKDIVFHKLDDEQFIIIKSYVVEESSRTFKDVKEARNHLLRLKPTDSLISRFDENIKLKPSAKVLFEEHLTFNIVVDMDFRNSKITISKIIKDV